MPKIMVAGARLSRGRGSPGVAFVRQALSLGYHVDAMDAYVKSEQLDSKIDVFKPDSLISASYDVAILFVPAPNYVSIPTSLDETTKIIDLWGLWKESKQDSYFRLGNYFV